MDRGGTAPLSPVRGSVRGRPRQTGGEEVGEGVVVGVAGEELVTLGGGVTVRVEETVLAAVAAAVGVRVPDVDGLGERVWETDAVPVRLPVMVCDGEPVCEPELVGEGVSEGELVPLGEGVPVRALVPVPEPVPVPVRVHDPVLLAEPEPDGEDVPVAAAEAVPAAVVDGVPVAVAEAVPVAPKAVIRHTRCPFQSHTITAPDCWSRAKCIGQVIRPAGSTL